MSSQQCGQAWVEVRNNVQQSAGHHFLKLIIRLVYAKVLHSFFAQQSTSPQPRQSHYLNVTSLGLDTVDIRPVANINMVNSQSVKNLHSSSSANCVGQIMITYQQENRDAVLG